MFTMNELDKWLCPYCGRQGLRLGYYPGDIQCPRCLHVSTIPLVQEFEEEELRFMMDEDLDYW